MNSLLSEEVGHYLIRIVIAALLGGLIGFERDFHGRAAGLRTHLLVSMGASVFMILSEIVAAHAKANPGAGLVNQFSDPGRIAAQIVTGIGFLGAGTIIKEGLSIRGLTTAACLWIVAAIGMAAGAGSYQVAVFTTFVSLTFLVALHYFERLYPKDSYRILLIETVNDVRTSTIIDKVNRDRLNIIYMEFERNYEKGLTTLKLHIRLFHRGLTDRLSHSIIESLEQAGIPLIKIRWSRH